MICVLEGAVDVIECHAEILAVDTEAYLAQDQVEMHLHDVAGSKSVIVIRTAFWSVILIRSLQVRMPVTTQRVESGTAAFVGMVFNSQQDASRVQFQRDFASL